MGLFLRLKSKKEDPIEINANPKNATLSFGKMSKLSPAVKNTIATPITTMIVLLMAAVEYRANSFLPVSVTMK